MPVNQGELSETEILLPHRPLKDLTEELPLIMPAEGEGEPMLQDKNMITQTIYMEMEEQERPIRLVGLLLSMRAGAAADAPQGILQGQAVQGVAAQAP